MTIEDRKSHFLTLGKFLGQFELKDSVLDEKLPHNEKFFTEMDHKIDSAVHHNGWFNRENVVFSLQEWSKALTRENLDEWLSKYEFKEKEPKTVAVIMAGNIPLVGFHDFLSVLISGHRVQVKQSSNDKQLLPVIAAYLMALEPEFEKYISFTDEQLDDFDAVIATGSNNTARYFEYYFGNKPNIIRKNRNSVAVLTGEESKEQLEALAEDIFRYYGLGCRNVSKLYVPEGYDFDSFFKAMYGWNPIINQAKYANNYDYNKAVYLMSEFKLLENGFLILKEDGSFGSPIATLFYETYKDKDELKGKLEAHKDKLQCVVSHNFKEDEVRFGDTQHPRLWDYADNVDTMEFLLNL
ncbi:acyl-CoA reductase [Salegentibacter chungangensis]|uniref:Acyl-CoA reductase n=1 Tax=Salegentibacter chungangensis TaxID=1335724 RepID=A0ABW3NRY5_9FLAO